MTTVLDIKANRLIAKVAGKLKAEKMVSPPKWMAFVKTGSHAERAPESPDFWYVRCASLLRRLYVKGPIGVSRLREKYGGRKHHTAAVAHFRKAGGSIIRKALQQLETAGLVSKVPKGRAISKKGVALLDGAARGVASEQ
jgi:small subunit ribosomal protein S19e